VNREGVKSTPSGRGRITPLEALAKKGIYGAERFFSAEEGAHFLCKEKKTPVGHVSGSGEGQASPWGKRCDRSIFCAGTHSLERIRQVLLQEGVRRA